MILYEVFVKKIFLFLSFFYYRSEKIIPLNAFLWKRSDIGGLFPFKLFHDAFVDAKVFWTESISRAQRVITHFHGTPDGTPTITIVFEWFFSGLWHSVNGVRFLKL